MTKENQNIDCRTLAQAIRLKRETDGLSLKAAEYESGVHASTLSRIEREIGVPDSDTISRLAAWLEIPMERVMGKRNTASVVFYANESTPAIIAEHLRKDRSLSPEAAQSLIELFRVAYAQMVKVQNGK